MKLLAVHVAPVWQEVDGSRTIGLNERRDHPVLAGWCRTALISIDGRAVWFLLTDSR